LVISRYFKHPSYWKIDGKPYFSIYEMQLFLNSFGTVQAAREALDQFRKKVEQAGFPGLHINAILWGQPNLPGGTTPADWSKLCAELEAGQPDWLYLGASRCPQLRHLPDFGLRLGTRRSSWLLDGALKNYPVPFFHQYDHQLGQQPARSSRCGLVQTCSACGQSRHCRATPRSL
jgi:hypothetical protein